MTDILKLCDELEALLEKAPALPYVYNLYQFDDWGVIRGGEPTTYGLPVVAFGRSGRVDSDLDSHRRAGSDPYEPVSQLIVASINALPTLLQALRQSENAAAIRSSGQEG